MRGRDHLGIGVVCGAALVLAAQVAGAPVHALAIAAGALAGGVGALAPDIDHPWSTISAIVPGMLFAGGTVLAVSPLIIRITTSTRGPLDGVLEAITRTTAGWWKLGLLLVAIALIWLLAGRLVSTHLGHRGPMHSLAAAAVATVVAAAASALSGFGPWYGLIFGVGWLTHLAADAPSRAGLPALLWPFASTTRWGAPAPAVRRQALADRASVAKPEPRANPQPVEAAEHVATAPEQPVSEHASATTPVCPRCQLPMALRTAKRGQHEGQQFYGCANFPRCRQTRRVE